MGEPGLRQNAVSRIKLFSHQAGEYVPTCLLHMPIPTTSEKILTCDLSVLWDFVFLDAFCLPFSACFNP